MTRDWGDPRRTDEIRVYMVCPTDLDRTYGELTGVDLSGCSIEAGYYTDTRVSAKLTVVGDAWVRGSFLRVVHRVPEWGYENELGTFVVTNDAATRENGVWKYELTCQSVLYGLSTDLLSWPVTRAKGSSAVAGMKYILDTCKRRYVNRGAKDKRLGSALVMETGKSMLSHLFKLCQQAGDRLDVDGHGRVTISPYVRPAAKEPRLTIDVSDPRGTSYGGLKRSTDWLSSVGRVTVSCRYSETVKKGKKSKTVSREIVAHADASAMDHRGSAVRGYLVTDFRSLSDMKPRTKAQAQKLANRYLRDSSPELVEWELDSAYMPVWQGDVVELLVPDGDDQYSGRRKCLVKSLSVDLANMTMSLRLKETSSGDKGESDD